MTPKQQRFIHEYLADCNGTQAAIRAGYSRKTAGAIAEKLLKKAEIRKAIDAAMSEQKNALIATREERQRFWTETLRNEEEDMKHRLRASELLGKSFCDFTERREVQAEVTCRDYDLTELSEEELVALRSLLSKATPKNETARKELNLINILTED